MLSSHAVATAYCNRIELWESMGGGALALATARGVWKPKSPSSSKSMTALKRLSMSFLKGKYIYEFHDIHIVFFPPFFKSPHIVLPFPGST